MPSETLTITDNRTGKTYDLPITDESLLRKNAATVVSRAAEADNALRRQEELLQWELSAIQSALVRRMAHLRQEVVDQLTFLRALRRLLQNIYRIGRKLLRRLAFSCSVVVRFEEFFFTHGEPRPPANLARKVCAGLFLHS